jgi:hypothetical protein
MHGASLVPANGREGLHVTTDWQYDVGASETGDRSGERLPKRGIGRRRRRFVAPAAPVTVAAPRAASTARAETLPGEQAVTDRPRPTPYWEPTASAKSCWMCGIRLPDAEMVADGGNACPDLRWYCQDTRACTERWTSRTTRPAAIREDAAGTRATPGGQARRADADRPVPV